MKTTATVTVIILLYCGELAAAPAFWYKWRSKVDGQIFCTQTVPGQGWVRIDDMPYTDAHCRHPANPR